MDESLGAWQIEMKQSTKSSMSPVNEGKVKKQQSLSAMKASLITTVVSDGVEWSSNGGKM
eukprot:449142-Ditylum_brightwellii.AAC.1